MKKISGAIVTYNESDLLLTSLTALSKFTDEIILFDSFSTDNTIEVAKRFNCTIYSHEYDNPRNQKNRAIEKCKNEWIFLIDTDEDLEEKLINNIPDLINQEDADCFSIPRRTFLDGKNVDHLFNFPDHQMRLFKNYIRYTGHPFHHTHKNYKYCKAIDDKGVIIHNRTTERNNRSHIVQKTLLPEDFIYGGCMGTIGTEHEKKWDDINVYKQFYDKK